MLISLKHRCKYNLGVIFNQEGKLKHFINYQPFNLKKVFYFLFFFFFFVEIYKKKKLMKKHF